MQAEYQKDFKVCRNELVLRLAQYGVNIEDETKPMERTATSSGLTFFISVPKNSELTLDDGTEACGEALAKYVKSLVYKNHQEFLFGVDNGRFKPFEDIFKFEVKVKYKERDEIWTREKEEKSTIDMMVKMAAYDKIKKESGEIENE